MNKTMFATATDNGASGYLQVQVTSIANNFPVTDATVSIAYKGDPDSLIEQVHTNISGQTENIQLKTPPLIYSTTPTDEQPYSEYNLRIEAPGFKTAHISGSQMLPDSTSIQPVRLEPITDNMPMENPIVIPDHTLYGNFPPKIAEAEIKPVGENSEIVLSRVVVPQTIIVHDGAPTDTTAQNYYVPYRDYIKNVASSEIYSTWPEATITANVLAIMSFTLNRVYTEWYRNQGYDFTITSSTAFDHKWVYGRNIFDNISAIVDNIFNNYLSRPDIKQPILTQYCDGRRVKCPNWMTQWGSCDLGERGYTAIEILRHFYGSDMYINTAEQISGIPASWPGENLTIGSTGDKVLQMQQQLNAIAAVYSVIPKLSADGNFGPATAAAVKAFQSTFNLPPTGIVDFATWYRISHIYVAVTRIAELG